MDHNAVTAIYPGSFDPITNGHIDVIRRGNKMFDRLIVAVGQNPGKTEFFSKQERLEMIRRLVADMPRVSVETFDCLTVEFAAQKKADVMLRGLRNLSDVQYEFQLAMTNRTVAGIETVFIMTDVSKLLPPTVYQQLRKKLAKETLKAENDLPE